MNGSVFSESWYKVAALKLSLKTSSYIKKQLYRGKEWYIIEDSFNNQFFRIKPEAYEFIMRLDHDKTVEEVWEECLGLEYINTPTQDEVINILTSLHHKNLLYFKNRADNQKLLERSQKRKSAEIKGKIFSFLYIKVPLFDPNSHLDKMKPFIELLLSKKMLFIWSVTLLIALKYILENITLIYDQTQGMLSPNNLVLLYTSIIVLKTFHEFGHAMMVKKFGGRVNTMGVMILIFTPIPFMDATQSWLFRSKYQRALVGAAGMIVELFFAAIAAIIWANSGDGIVHSISFNMMIIGSVSSVFFNGNPLLRFDSYFILSDLLEIPNLYEKSKRQWFYLIENYIFRLPNLISPSDTKSEAFWMYSYGILSFFYRLFVALAIAIFVADQWFILGVVVVVTSVFIWVLKPLYGFFKYLFSDNKLRKTRVRASLISIFSLLFIVVFFTIIPFAFSIKANGIVLANNYSSLFLKSAGYLKSVNIKNGTFVKKGDTIAIFYNKELDFDIESLKASIEESEAYIIKARDGNKADIVAIKEHLNLLRDKVVYLEKRKKELSIVAQNDGYFVYENLDYKTDTWFHQGVKIGVLLPNKEVHFEAVVPQEEAYSLFKSQLLDGSIKLYGSVKETIALSNLSVIPYQKQELPSASLGWLGGGDIATSRSDQSGTKAKESFFEVRAEVIKNDNINFLHGRSGVLKIELTPITLFERFKLGLKQVLQKHYKI